MNAYEVSLADFVAHRAAITQSSPAKVLARIEAVIKSATALMRNVERLELADRMLVGKCETRRLLRDQPYVGQQKLLATLDLFLPVVKEAQNIIAKEPRHGRMPAYAARSLAVLVGQMLFEETKVMPTQTTNGQFDQLLRLAFTHAKAPRKDVTKLMAHALPHIAKDVSLLPSFRTTLATNRK